MSAEDKAKNKAEELKGKVEKKVGEATDNEQLEAEGKGKEVKGGLKQAGEKAKDALTGDEDKK
ncbi:CsbD family protein [Saccharopolyspora pogona]|uniref:CsbD family protein n=1 Tax=Saccharopolyspora pogona TaxID=333966 RepID=UPI001683F17A|nr:CsbD family protein [Saccharopolyspora pogona]